MDGVRWLQAQWDRTAGWGLVVGGAVLVAAAAVQARRGLYVPDQFSFLMSGGVGGLASAALGSALLLSASLHDEWRAFDSIEAALGQRDARFAGRENGETLVRWIRAEWDRVLGAVAVAAAFIWLLIGYRGLADSLYPPAQVAYLISTGLASLGCLFVGLTVLLVADLRDEDHKVRRIRRALGSPDERIDALLRHPGIVVVLLGTTMVVLGLGWVRAANALDVDRAMEGLDIAVVGLGGMFLVLVGSTVSVRRRLVRRASQMLAALPGVAVRSEPIRPTTNVEGFWTVKGLQRYHRASCPTLTWARGERQPVAGTAQGLEPCLLCEAGE